MAGSPSTGRYEKIYAVIRKIPRGKVGTYGQVALLAGIPGAARQVGYALHALPGDGDVPWHRVINAQGKISPRTGSDHDVEQRILLESEGIIFDQRGRIPLDTFQWDPLRRSSRRTPG